ncbi:MAG: acyl-ACP--UDP-N-acetylglucosamine O-acyltransferase [Phycisphaerales bacterium]
MSRTTASKPRALEVDAQSAHTPAIVDPTAVIHPSAIVEDGARIGPYCVLGPNVRVGKGTVLHSHVVVQTNTTLGEHNEVFPFAVLGPDPQDLKFRGEDAWLEIGDRNVIREHATLHRGTSGGGGYTRVGSGCLLMVGAHVAHDCVLEDNVILANGVMLGGHCIVGSGATVAGAAAVHHFTTIGPLAFVAGLARVVKDVPPYLVVEGSPAEPRKVNTVALTRRGWSDEEVECVKRAFRCLFRAKGDRKGGEDETVRQRLARLREEEAGSKAVITLCDFVERMGDGVHGRWLETQRIKGASA